VCGHCHCCSKCACDDSGQRVHVEVSGCQHNIVLMCRIDNAMRGMSNELGCWQGGIEEESGVAHG